MKSAQRQFLTKVDGIDGYWAQKSGGEVTAEATKVWDGGSMTPSVLAAPSEVGDVTLTRPFDPMRDQPVLNELIKRVGTWRTTVTISPTEADLTVSKVDPRVYSDALLVGVREPESDASSGDAADMELTFSIGDVS